MSQIIISIVSIFKIVNAQNETYWILTIVLTSLIFIFFFSLFEEKESGDFTSLIENNTKRGMKLKMNNSKNENVPDVLEEGWDLPL